MERVDAFTIEWIWYLEEIWGASDSFLAMEVIVEPLEYLDTLVKNVKLYAWEVTKKNDSLDSSQMSLSKVEVVLKEVKWSLNP